MKRAPVVLALVFMLTTALAPAAGAGKIFCDDHGNDLFHGDEISIDFEDGTLIIEADEYDEYVEITDDYDLYVNGDKVKLDKEQRRLVKNYHQNFEEILDLAEEIGLEGAKIGAKGAKLGLKAVANVIKLVLEDYDSDDLERELEKEAKKIEKAAEKLEKRAEKLEDVAEDFERTHKKMRKKIKALDELDWF